MSLISLSRRDLLARTIATGAGVMLSSLDGRLAPAQSMADADQIRNGIINWNNSVAEKPPLVKEWLANSEVIKATKNEFSSFHGDWANDWAYQHPSRTWVRGGTLFGQVDPFWMGLVYHPWQHIDGYAPNRTLNTVELSAQYEQRTFFEQTLTFFSEGRLVFAPFPDTPRLPITTVYEESFVRIVRRANLNPDNYKLHYARYHVMAGRRGSQVVPRPLLAHCYAPRTAVTMTEIKEQMRITYTSSFV